MLKYNIGPEYIAGFFDGEGCIYAHTTNLRVIITNTNKKMLEDISEYFGDGKLGENVRIKKRNGEGNRKQCYTLTFWNRRAERVLIELLPYLQIKRPEAELAIEFMGTMRRRGEGNGKFGNTKLSDEILNKRSELCLQIKQLKLA